ncbi:MAG: hypothetical protein Q7T21_04345 [Gallionella sp.]|nr:hypothetical protein [Gallionella sp.]
MGIFGHLFGRGSKQESPELLSAIERAVLGVEPLLKQTTGYPENYRKPVTNALEYAISLAASVPGPVVVDRESYASDAFVHVLFPSLDSVTEALCSSLALQDYLREFPAMGELYALMGMRRFEKSLVGMEMSGQTIQRDVEQKVVYFTSHTLENPAPSEQQARDRVAMGFFDSLVGKVKRRVEERKQGRKAQQLEKDMLMARLRTANALERPALEGKLAGLLSSMQSTISSLELSNYTADFEAVLLNPEQYLRLDQKQVNLDSMGIRRNGDGASRGEAFMFNDLIGYDRRDWTVTMVRCNNLHSEAFATKLEKAYRKLAI